MKPLAYCEDLGDRLVVVNANASKRNALSPEYYSVLLDALELAGAQSRITSVVLRSDGGFFCSGGDLTLLASRRDLPLDQRLRKVEDLHDVIRAVMDCPKPVIAAVEGGAAGAGMSLAFACDFIVAEREAKFTVAYVKAGLVPDGGLTSLLSASLPRAMLMQMALLGQPVLATRLFELGALSQLVEKGEMVAAVTALGDQLSIGASVTQGAIKKLVNTAQKAPVREQMDAERDAMARAVAAPEAEEGIRAILGKRAPDFKAVREA